VSAARILLPNKDSIISDEEVNVTLRLNELVCDIRLRIIPVLQWDVILGLDWEQQFKKTSTHWDKKTFKIKRWVDGKTFTIPIRPHKIEFISAKQIKSLIRKKQLVYLAFLSGQGTIKTADQLTELEKEFIGRWRSVFTEDLPDEPVDRGVEHEIHLEEGTVPIFKRRSWCRRARVLLVRRCCLHRNQTEHRDFAWIIGL